MLWGEGVQGSARDVLAEVEAVDTDRSATDEAMDWLRDALEAGPMPAGQVLKSAKLSGLSDKALRTARERLGIKPKRNGFGPGSSVTWALPRIDAIHGIDAHSVRGASMTSMETDGASMGDAVEVFDL